MLDRSRLSVDILGQHTHVRLDIARHQGADAGRLSRRCGGGVWLRRGRRRHTSRQVGPFRSLVLVIDQDCCDWLTDIFLDDRERHGGESIPDRAYDDIRIAQAWTRNFPVDIADVRGVTEVEELLVERVHLCDERLVVLGASDVLLNICGSGVRCQHRMERVHHVRAKIRFLDANEAADELVSGNVSDHRPVNGSVGQNPGVGHTLQLVGAVVSLPARELLGRGTAGKRNVEREAVGAGTELRVVVDREQ